MGVKLVNTTRTPKGTVSISPYKDGLRIRWRYGDSRQELYVSPTIPNLLLISSTVKKMIEHDLKTGNYDVTRLRYKKVLSGNESSFENSTTIAVSQESKLDQLKGNEGNFKVQPPLLKDFERYLAVKGIKELPNYYYFTQRMLVKWDVFDLEDVPILLAAENLANRTFNDRRNCLFKFFEWLVVRKKIKDNPLAEVSTKRKGKTNDRRKPFSDSEAHTVLEALKSNRYIKSSQSTHAQYYPLVAFMFHTGVRNGEAVGLKVREVNFEKGDVRIANSFSRTRRGSHIKARILKGTKMDNVRFLPLDAFLSTLLHPLCIGRNPDDFVFINRNANPIDDRMFQRRVFKPLLNKLNIENRDLYACRHTFATRAVQQGMKPYEVAYLMGDSVETVLRNYFHNNQRPEFLPKPIQ